MKISPKKYAESLLSAIDGKSKDEAREIISRLLKLLVANGDIDKMPAVIKYFEKYWNAKEGLSVVEVTTAKEMDKDLRKAVNDYAADKFKVNEVELKEKVDPSILGGFIIKEGDKVFDASVKARLYGLRERIVK